MKKFSLHISLAFFILSIATGAVFAFILQPPAIAEVAAPVVVEEPASEAPAPAPKREFTSPIRDANRRVTKKPFGLEILPGRSPVPNDRFTGYHVGTDFETFEDEQDGDVPIFAACAGKLLFKKHATGYGGVAVEACSLGGSDVSVIYGHLNLTSIAAEAGDELLQGELIGFLGRGYSEETDGVRKHLHLGIHEGSAIDIRGYVQDEAELHEWRDPLTDMAL